MIQDRRLGSLTTRRPPDRGGDACAATAADGAERIPSGRIASVTMPVALRIVPLLHRQRMPRFLATFEAA
jgi:hypothetical protein